MFQRQYKLGLRDRLRGRPASTKPYANPKAALAYSAGFAAGDALVAGHSPSLPAYAKRMAQAYLKAHPEIKDLRH